MAKKYKDAYGYHLYIDGKQTEVNVDYFTEDGGASAYAEAYPGASIRMRDENGKDYNVPLEKMEYAKTKGLHPFRFSYKKEYIEDDISDWLMPGQEDKPAEKPIYKDGRVLDSISQETAPAPQVVTPAPQVVQQESAPASPVATPSASDSVRGNGSMLAAPADTTQAMADTLLAPMASMRDSMPADTTQVYQPVTDQPSAQEQAQRSDNRPVMPSMDKRWAGQPNVTKAEAEQRDNAYVKRGDAWNNSQEVERHQRNMAELYGYYGPEFLRGMPITMRDYDYVWSNSPEQQAAAIKKGQAEIAEGREPSALREMREDYEKALAYSRGESSERPLHWDYWRRREGLAAPVIDYRSRMGLGVPVQEERTTQVEQSPIANKVSEMTQATQEMANEASRQAQRDVDARAIVDATVGDQVSAAVAPEYAKVKDQVEQKAREAYEGNQGAYSAIPNLSASLLAQGRDWAKNTDLNTVIENVVKNVAQQDVLVDATKEYMQLGYDAEEAQNMAINTIAERAQEDIYQAYKDSQAPSSTLEYILGNAVRNSIAGMIAEGAVEDKMKVQLRDEAYAEAGAKQGMGARVASGVGSLLLDAPVFAATGGVGNFAAQAGSKAVSKGVAKMALNATGKLGTQAGSRYFGTSLTGRMLQGSIASGTTLGLYDGLSETTRQLRTGEMDLGAIANRASHGYMMGAMLGPIGQGAKYLSRNMSKAGKMATSAGAFVTEAELFNLGGLVSSGQEINLANHNEGFAESAMTLLLMKGSHKLPQVGKVFTKQGRADIREAINARYNSPDYMSNARFTKEDEAVLRDCGYDIKDLFKVSTKEVKGNNALSKKAEGNAIDFETATPETIKKQEYNKAIESETEFLETYARMMKDANVPMELKAKMALRVEGKVTTNMPLETGATYRNENGRYVVETLSPSGEIMSRRYFDSESQAKKLYNDMESVCEANSYQVCERVVDALASEKALNAIFMRMGNGGYGVARSIAEKVAQAGKKNAESRTEQEQRLLNVFGALVEEAKPTLETSARVREAVERKSGMVIADILSKPANKRSLQEVSALAEYRRELESRISVRERAEENIAREAERIADEAEAERRASEAEQSKVLEGRRESEEILANDTEGKVEIPTEKGGATIEDVIAISRVEADSADYMRRRPEDYAEEIAEAEAERRAAIDYREGKIAEKPDNYEYWADREGFIGLEPVEAKEPVPTVEAKNDQASAPKVEAVEAKNEITEEVKPEVTPREESEWGKANGLFIETQAQAEARAKVGVVDGVNKHGVHITQVEKRANELGERTGVKVKVRTSIEEVEHPEARAAVEAGKEVTGWYNTKTGEVEIYAPEIMSQRDLDQTYVHEVVSHKGIDGLLGKDNAGIFYDKVYEFMTEEQRARYEGYTGVGGIKDSTKRRRAAASEFVAKEFAEKEYQDLSAEERSIWDRIVTTFQELLNKILGNNKLTREDIVEVLRQSYRKLRLDAEKSAEVTASEAKPSAKKRGVQYPDELLASDRDLSMQEIKDRKRIYRDYNKVLSYDEIQELNRLNEECDRLAPEADLASERYHRGEITAQEYFDAVNDFNELFSRRSALYEKAHRLKEENSIAPKAKESKMSKHMANELDKNGLEADIENGDVRMSVRFSPSSEKEKNAVIRDIVAATGRSRAEVKRWVDSEMSLANLVRDGKNSEYLDYKADDRYKAIKDNSDYPQGTVDFNNICRKRAEFTAMFDKLHKEFPNYKVSGKDLAAIREIMRGHGFDVACGLCYVEDRRQLMDEVAQQFINGLNSDFVNYAVNESKKKVAAKIRKAIGDDGYIPTINDLVAPTGSKELSESHPGVWEAFSIFNNARGQQSQNLFQGYAEYKREILGWDAAKVRTVNDNGGLRVFSYSDFETHHLIDLVQIIQDCAVKGVKIQGYTKVPEFARIVEKTNMKINRSLIPLGDTGIKDGKLAYDPVEGIDINNPNFTPSNKNIGNVLVGCNDEQIRLAMRDPFIHYIIPFHSNQAKALLVAKGVGAWTNYKYEQREYNKSGGAAENGVNIYVDIINAAEAEGNPIKTEREFVERFLAECESRDLIPRFERFLDKDENGRYVYTPGYYKLLLDFKLFDENGRILPQQPVVAKFDDALIKQVIEEYVAGEEAKKSGNYGERFDVAYSDIKDALGLDSNGGGNGGGIRFNSREEYRDILVDAAEKASDIAEVIKERNQLNTEIRSLWYKMEDWYERNGDAEFDAEMNAYKKRYDELNKRDDELLEYIRLDMKRKAKDSFDKVKNEFYLTKDNATDYEWALMKSVAGKVYSANADYKKIGDTLIRVKGHTANWDRFENEYGELEANNIINVTVGDYENTDYRRNKGTYEEFVANHPEAKAVDIEISDGEYIGDALAKIESALKEKGILLEFKPDYLWAKKYSKESNNLDGELAFSSREVKRSYDNTENEESTIRFRVVDDPEEVAWFEESPKIIGYRNLVKQADDSYRPPMADALRGNGITRRMEGFKLGEIIKSEETPEIVKENGKVDLVKPNGLGVVADVEYNPYNHHRKSLVNSQFKQAWKRPDLVYVECEIPIADIETGYQADKAALPVGDHPWNGGNLILSRYSKAIGEVPWERVADDWVERFKDRGVEFDIVPPALLPILENRGVEILPPHKGMGKDCNDAYEAWKDRGEVVVLNEGIRFASREMPWNEGESLGDALSRNLKEKARLEIELNKLERKRDAGKDYDADRYDAVKTRLADIREGIRFMQNGPTKPTLQEGETIESDSYAARMEEWRADLQEWKSKKYDEDVFLERMMQECTGERAMMSDEELRETLQAESDKMDATYKESKWLIKEQIISRVSNIGVRNWDDVVKVKDIKSKTTPAERKQITHLLEGSYDILPNKGEMYKQYVEDRKANNPELRELEEYENASTETAVYDAPATGNKYGIKHSDVIDYALSESGIINRVWVGRGNHGMIEFADGTMFPLFPFDMEYLGWRENGGAIVPKKLMTESEEYLLNQFLHNEIETYLPNGIKDYMEAQYVDSHTREVMNEVREWYDDLWSEMESLGMTYGKAKRDFYVTHIWDKSKSTPVGINTAQKLALESKPKEIVDVESYVATNTPYMRTRMFDSLLDGMALGLVPKYEDIADIVLDYGHRAGEAIENRKLVMFLKNLKVNGIPALREVGGRNEGIYTTINNNALRGYEVLKAIKPTLNVIFGPTHSTDYAWLQNLGKSYDVVGGIAKKIELSLSFFHHGALTETAIAMNGPVRTLKIVGKHLMWDCINNGDIPAFNDPKLTRDAVKHLVVLGATQDYAAKNVQAFTEQLVELTRKIHGVHEATKLVDFINRGSDKILWDYLHDGLKVYSYSKLAKEIRSRAERENIPADVVEKKLNEAGQLVNDTFGGQHWELLGWSPLTVKWMRRLMLSPDWTMSTMRQALAPLGVGQLYNDEAFWKKYFKGDDVASVRKRYGRAFWIRAALFAIPLVAGINMCNRMEDEEEQKAIAEEKRKTNPDYKSPYEMAYPNGMKWYDYTMYGNTIGHSTHLFMGRYDDGTERYLRWGKQFRELPETLFGPDGFGFPYPLIHKIVGKMNPMVDLLINFASGNSLTGWTNQDMADTEGWDRLWGAIQYGFKKFIPFVWNFDASTEFKLTDLVMPSTKGFSRYKAIKHFKAAIMDDDKAYAKVVMDACKMNGLNGEQMLETAYKVLEAEGRKNMLEGVENLDDAIAQYDVEKNPSRRKQLKNYIIRQVSYSDIRMISNEQAVEEAWEVLMNAGSTERRDDKYNALNTSEDVLQDWRLSQAITRLKKYNSEYNRKKTYETAEAYYNEYKAELDKYDELIYARRYINELKSMLGNSRVEDAQLMQEIRAERAKALDANK